MAFSTFQMEYHYQHHFNMFPNMPSSSSSSSITATANDSQFMDPKVWRRLPNFLLTRIVAFLPAPSFFRFQSVCRRWYRLLFSHTFLQTYHSISRNHHWFIFFKRKTLNTIITTNNNVLTTSSGICEGFLYDPVTRAWFRLTFPSWMSSYSPAASSNGLIAWVSDESGKKNLIISNPVRREIAPLPSPSTPRFYPSVGLVTTNSVFYVIVSGDDQPSAYNVDNISTESFHAYQDEVNNQTVFSSVWNIQSKIPPKYNPETGRMVFVDGKFYCMSYNPSLVFSYDIWTNTWAKIKPPMERFIRWPGLVECGGRLMLVAAVAKGKLSIPKSVRVWEFRNDAWGNHPEHMPEQVYLEFAEVGNGNGFDCVGHGNFIVITFNGSDKILLFDLGAKNWQWVPECPYLYHYGGWSGGSLHAFAYEPRIETPVMRLFEQP